MLSGVVALQIAVAVIPRAATMRSQSLFEMFAFDRELLSLRLGWRALVPGLVIRVDVDCIPGSQLRVHGSAGYLE